MKHIAIAIHIVIKDDGEFNANNTSYKPHTSPSNGIYFPPNPAKSTWSDYLDALPTVSNQKSDTDTVISFPTCKLLGG